VLSRYRLATDFEDRRVKVLEGQIERYTLRRYERVEVLRAYARRIVLCEEIKEVVPDAVLKQHCRLSLHFFHRLTGNGYLYDLASEVRLETATVGGNGEGLRSISFRLCNSFEFRRAKCAVRLRLSRAVGVGG